MSNKWIKALVIVSLTWLVLMSCQAVLESQSFHILPHLIGGGARAEREDTLSHSIAAVTEVEIHSQNGSITLIGSDTATEISVAAVYRAQASTQSSAERRLEQLTTDLLQSGERLVIRAVYGGNWSRDSISYTVTLPQEMLVQAKTSNGRITADNLSGEVTLTTSNGQINVTANDGPQQLAARTSNGKITVNASPNGGNYVLNTSNGTVQVRLPQELGVSLEARTSNGKINLGAGEWVFSGGQISNSRVSAQRGAGELELRITTSNGSIDLQSE